MLYKSDEINKIHDPKYIFLGEDVQKRVLFLHVNMFDLKTSNENWL